VNPLPSLLHTPTGLALLELQGDIRFPPTPASSTTHIGKLVFPLYKPEIHGAEDTKWMKRVWFYVGGNQRLAGEVKKLQKPIAVVGRREAGEVEGTHGGDARMEGVEGDSEEGDTEDLEVVEIVRWKVVFSSRPEPVGGEGEEGG
jgi:chromosome transmission fidelity protein 8